MTLLTNEELHRLAEIVLEECGSSLTNTAIAEYAGLLLEDIPGFELARPREISTAIATIRRYYRDAVHQDQDERDSCSGR